MAAINTGAPTRPQLKADLKLRFSDYMSADQRRRLRELPNPIPQNTRTNLLEASFVPSPPGSSGGGRGRLDVAEGPDRGPGIWEGLCQAIRPKHLVLPTYSLVLFWTGLSTALAVAIYSVDYHAVCGKVAVLKLLELRWPRSLILLVVGAC